MTHKLLPFYYSHTFLHTHATKVGPTFTYITADHFIALRPAGTQTPNGLINKQADETFNPISTHFTDHLTNPSFDPFSTPFTDLIIDLFTDSFPNHHPTHISTLPATLTSRPSTPLITIISLLGRCPCRFPMRPFLQTNRDSIRIRID